MDAKQALLLSKVIAIVKKRVKLKEDPSHSDVEQLANALGVATCGDMKSDASKLMAAAIAELTSSSNGDPVVGEKIQQIIALAQEDHEGFKDFVVSALAIVAPDPTTSLLIGAALS